MKTYKRICQRNWFIQAQNGDRQDLHQGRAYLTSKPHDDGTVTVFSSFWVRAPLDIFHPWDSP
jgi:hypothetical protein